MVRKKIAFVIMKALMISVEHEVISWNSDFLSLILTYSSCAVQDFIDF